MSFMYSMKNQSSDMNKMRERYNELRDKEMRGELDDAGREELRALRSKMQKMSE